MIRRHEDHKTWLIHQGAHAFIAGKIAEHWVGGGEMRYAPRDELILAAHHHDAGWTDIEQQPTINDQGWPRTFTEMPLQDHFAIWEGSILGVFVQNRYAGLLTCLHCLDLYDQRLRYLDDPPAIQTDIRQFVARWTAWKDALIAAMTDHPRYSLAVQRDALAQNVRLLQVWDYLSLSLCMGAFDEQALEDVPLDTGRRGLVQMMAGGPRTLLLDPYPLDGPLTLWIDARQVPGAPFATDDALRQVLAECSYRPLVFELAPVS